jgi:ribosomal protein S18 acetylase RimI-like enzyme
LSGSVEDGYQRRGLARMLLTNGLDQLARKGAHRLKVGFKNSSLAAGEGRRDWRGHD